MVKNARSPHDDDMSLIDKYLEHLRKEQDASPRTVEGREYVLRRLDRELPQGLEVATADELGTWLYRPEWSGHTKATWCSAVAAFFAWACDPRDQWLDYNPVDYLPTRPKAPRGVPRPVTDQVLQDVLARAVDPYRMWVLLAAYQGLRCLEISRLDREDITEQVLFVRGKGNKQRTGVTHPDVWAAVRDFPPGPIARGANGQRISERYISIRTAVYLRRDLNLPGVSLHRMRHWFGTTVQAMYKDIRVTQELLGHNSLQSTQIYTMASTDQMKAAIGMLPRLA